MNTVAEGGLDWRAIFLGAIALLAVGYAGSFLLNKLLPINAFYDGRAAWLLPLMGLLSRTIGGAIAGLLARRRGAVHGALAALLGTAASSIKALAGMALGGYAGLVLPSYLVQLAIWGSLGVGAAAIAGHFAARAAADLKPRLESTR